MAVQFSPVSSRLRRIDVAVVVTLSLLSMTMARGQDPTIDRIDAQNLRPGQKASVTVVGKQLNGALSLWMPAGVLRPGAGVDVSKDQPIVLEGDIRQDAVPGIYPARLVTTHGCSEAAWVVVDDLPSVPVAAEADDRKAGQLVTLPCCLNAQLNPVVSKFFRTALRTGQAVSIEVFARRLGSDLDPVLRVTDPNGAEVGFCDDIPGAEGDTQLQFVAAADGEYRVEVRDVRYSGGGRHFFHLRLGRFPLAAAATPRIAQTGHKVALIGTSGEVLAETTAAAAPEPSGLIPVSFKPGDADASVLESIVITPAGTQAEAEPNDVREQATTISAETQVLTGTLQAKGDSDWFRITVSEASPLLVTARTREVTSPADVILELYNADGGRIAENDDSGPRDAELSAQLPAAGDFFLKVSEIAGRGGSQWTYALDVFRGRKAVRVTAPVDRLNVPRGGNASMPLTIRRIHYDGPLKVEAVGLPASLTMSPFTIGAKQSTVPVVLTAANAAASASDADWGPVSFRITSMDGTTIPQSDLQIAPPPPKKTDAEVFRSQRLRSDVFAAVAPAVQFSLSVDPGTVSVAQGTAATVMVKSVRAADWTEPIEIALSVPADQLPPGITVTGGSMAAGELAVTVTAAADAAVGPFTVFLQGKSKKEKAEPVHPVPPIVVEVKAP